ncbi:MAG: AMP-binding protein [Hydrogenophaga sp.]|jgi:fatty-acyl-CoA synthase|uniref:AMP-binding protein n=1 Tax=Hydrogenophaga sp. TaxID=1904254 RepID=UPI001D3572F0|nr:AMP-binding protein [Hydrogenophaga sp.]MBW0168796.1 AMP-binding protein [Hydrogenophaga sp.]MBW0185316.1 AMP-binding protein [Hydrogenophaga sp.]
MPHTPASTASYTQGATLPALHDITIGQALEQAARQWGEREALVIAHQEVRWSWTELLRRSDALAAGLLALGLEPGDRVGIWAPNCAEWTLMQFATARAGLILVNINPAYRSNELAYALNKVSCKALVLAPALKSSNYIEILRSLAPELDAQAPGQLQAAALPHLRWAIRLGEERTAGMLAFDDVPALAGAAERAQLAAIAARLRPTDPINIQFTSGTTGFPKGATLTHRNILNNGFFVGEAIRLTPQDRLCIPVPLYHCFGMVMGNLACVTHGCAMVYPSEAFDPLAVLHTVQAERCTALYGVPTMFIAVLDHPLFSTIDLSSLRTGIMAGSPCPIEVMKRVQSQMHMHEVTIAYGMTETSPVSTQSAVDDPVDRRVSTVGRVQPHLEVQIVDTDNRVVPRGVVGELCTRGYSVMLGYWDDAEKTREAIDAEGWMHTGDLATMDAEGYVNIVGRLKDMVIRGGENVYPREVEEFYYRHPKVQDVQVVGVPDPRFGEVLCACVVLKAGEKATPQELQDFARGQIAHYKVPAYFEFVDAFPMTITGKIQKFVLRDAMVAKLNLKAAATA